MQVGLVDVDGHNWPNLCLMKISAWHKARGDDVGWWQPGGRYDVVYKSRVLQICTRKMSILSETQIKLFAAAPAMDCKTA